MPITVWSFPLGTLRVMFVVLVDTCFRACPSVQGTNTCNDSCHNAFHISAFRCNIVLTPLCLDRSHVVNQLSETLCRFIIPYVITLASCLRNNDYVLKNAHY
jgi:hypothetical protein